MNPIVPPLLRKELYHPLLVHLPIGILPITVLFLFLYLLLGKKEKFRFFKPSFLILLFISSLALILADQTGEMAEKIINKTICDPTMTHAHSEAAEVVMILTHLSFVISIIVWWFKTKKEFIHERKVDIFVFLILLTALGFLVKTGHLGASLTYQQGAGVYHPTPECKEFE
jgi:uncharacterized membrane protein